MNYTLSGRRLDVQLKGSVLPGYEDDWERVLVAIEDVTEREAARRRLADSEDYARGLFEHSPVSLWVEDFSSVKRLLDEVRDRGISDFRVFTDVHPEFVAALHERDPRARREPAYARAVRRARQADAAAAASARCSATTWSSTSREQLIDLWDGKLFQQREVVNYALDGNELHVHLQFSVLPGHEDDWSLVQVALTDITARKKAEAYLEYPRQARRADQALQPLLLCRRAEPAGAARAPSRSPSSWPT